jgi:hypothetical protein
MGNKSSKASSNETSIPIDGFGGLSIGFPHKLTQPFNIVGIYIDNPNKVTLPNNSSPTNKTIVEVATLTTRTPQKITMESKNYTFGVGTYYINKTRDGNYILMNDSDNSLSTLIKPLSTGGKRKRHTKRRKTNKRTRRRSIRT